MDSVAAEDPSIWRCCLDVARQLISKNLDFCFDLKVGTFSISLDAQKTRRHLLSREAAKSKPKHKSPSTIKRNKQRMDQFLSKKRAGAFSATSSLSPDLGCHLPEIPKGAPNQENPGDKDQGETEINLVTSSTVQMDSETRQRFTQMGREDVEHRIQATFREMARLRKEVKEGLARVEQSREEFATRQKTINEIKVKNSEEKEKIILCPCCGERMLDIMHICNESLL